MAMGDPEDSKENPVGDSMDRRPRRSFYKNLKFWGWAVGTTIALLGLWLTWMQYRDREASRERQGKAQILQALDSFDLNRQQVERGIADSVRAARERAGARGVLPSGSAGAYEVRRSLRPLEELVQDEWLRTCAHIKQILTESGVSDTTLATTRPFQDLQPRYETIEIRKDSTLARIRRAEDETSGLR